MPQAMIECMWMEKQFLCSREPTRYYKMIENILQSIYKTVPKTYFRVKMPVKKT